MNNLTSFICNIGETGIKSILSYDKIYECDSCGFVFLGSDANIKIDEWVGKMRACPECNACEGWFSLASLPINSKNEFD